MWLRLATAALTTAVGGMALYAAGGRALAAADDLTARLTASLSAQHAVRGRLADDLSAVPARSAAVLAQLLPVVRETLLRCTDMNEAVNAIRAATAARGSGHSPLADASLDGLWEEVKLRSLTRVITAVYAIALLAIIIGAEQTLLIRLSSSGGSERVANGPFPAGSGAAASAPPTQEEAEALDVLVAEFCEGVTALASRVRAAVAAMTHSRAWSVSAGGGGGAASGGSALTLSDFAGLFHGVRAALECDHPDYRMGGIVRALLPLQRPVAAHPSPPLLPPLPPPPAPTDITATVAWDARFLVGLTLDAARSPACDAAFATVAGAAFDGMLAIVGSAVLPSTAYPSGSIPTAAALLGLRKAAHIACDCPAVGPLGGTPTPASIAWGHPAVGRLCHRLLWEAKLQ